MEFGDRPGNVSGPDLRPAQAKQVLHASLGIACGPRQAESCEIVRIQAGDVILLCGRDRLLRLHDFDSVCDTGIQSVSRLLQRFPGKSAVTFSNG